MKKWTVKLPIAGSLMIYGVEAESKKEAVRAALETEYKEGEHDLEWSQMEHLTRGNVCYADTIKAEATEV